jgi:hypothetical protein
VADDRLPARIASDANLAVLPEEIRLREGRAWLIDWQGTRGVLRELPPATTTTRVLAPGASADLLTDDVRWLHAFLARLAEAEFPEIGALLGRYHVAVRGIDMASQRPRAAAGRRARGLALAPA